MKFKKYILYFLIPLILLSLFVIFKISFKPIKKYPTHFILFLEGASATEYERKLIYTVIKNRINHKGFNNKKLNNINDVINQDGAFSCIKDQQNHYWKLYKKYNKNIKKFETRLKSNILEYRVYLNCKDIVEQDLYIKEFNAVYYHDKSIDIPFNWGIKWWDIILVKETKHFKFYKIEAK